MPFDRNEVVKRSFAIENELEILRLRLEAISDTAQRYPLNVMCAALDEAHSRALKQLEPPTS